MDIYKERATALELLPLFNNAEGKHALTFI